MLETDAKIVLKCKNWSRSVDDTDAWRRIEEAKARVGL
jgi:hypothetical protein